MIDSTGSKPSTWAMSERESARTSLIWAVTVGANLPLYSIRG